MKRKTFTPQQIAKILLEFADAKSVAEISREHGGSQAAFYKWRQLLQRLGCHRALGGKDLEEENRRFKVMYAELALNLKAARDSCCPSTEACFLDPCLPGDETSAELGKAPQAPGCF
jgi:putative transposase